MSKRQKLDSSCWIVSTDEMESIVSFMDTSKTFNNLALCNKTIMKQCELIIENTNDKITFFRGLGVDPRLSLMIAQGKGWKIPRWAHEVLKGGLDLLIYYKALFRSPGGNTDQFILKFQVSFNEEAKLKVMRSKVHCADGNYMVVRPFESKVERQWTNLLAAIERQSFEKKTDYESLKVNTVGHNEDYFFTILDEVQGSEKFNTDEYCGKWTFVNLQVSYKNEKIFSIVRRAVHKEKHNSNPVDSSPVAEKLFSELQEFCEVSSVAECEHDECEDYENDMVYESSKSGIEINQVQVEDIDIDEEERDNSNITDILHKLIEE